jgi:NIMA (never in mitosis gene a)-related kinase
MDFETLNELAGSAGRARTATFREQYEVVRVLGKGSFGTVHLVHRVGHHTKYVAKEIPFFDDSNGKFAKNMTTMASNEAQILSHFSHPHIVRYFSTVCQADRLFLVMEYVSGGDLKRAIESQKICGEPFEEKTIVEWIRQLLSALKYIHEQKILHRDVKPANIFLSGDWHTLKLGDFGLTKALGDDAEQAVTICGTPQYFSPELCMKAPYTSSADIWAAGCVLFELMFLEHPYRANSVMATMSNILAGRVCNPAMKAQTSFSAELHASLFWMLAADPAERPSASWLLARPPFDTPLVITEAEISLKQRMRSRLVEKTVAPSTHR